jgi:hypothetical protein
MEFGLIFLFVVAVFFGYRLYHVEKKLRTLFGGAKAKTLESLVGEHHQLLERLHGESGELQKAVFALEKNFLRSVQKVGIVRFNPFPDSGGDQSFAIALLDGNDNGIALSSIYVHGTPMVYAKPIEKGDSKYALSQEEKDALGRASVLQ